MKKLSIEDRATLLAHYIIETKDTVRSTAKKFGVSKSTVHKDVSDRLLKINPVLAKQVREILDENKAERHLRGGMATKLKYLKEKAPNIDLVLFPVDRRMGKDYMKGAKQFIEQIKTTIFVPMHFSEDYEGGNALRSFAENAGCRFISITRRGESFEITK